jgi:hypothetical protein
MKSGEFQRLYGLVHEPDSVEEVNLKLPITPPLKDAIANPTIAARECHN